MPRVTWDELTNRTATRAPEQPVQQVRRGVQITADDMQRWIAQGETAQAGINPDDWRINTQVPIPENTIRGNRVGTLRELEEEIMEEIIFDDMVNTPKKEQEIKDPDKKRIAKEIIIGKEYKYPPLSKYEGLEGNTPMRAGTTFVGVEIELEKVDVGEIPHSTWKIHNDGSLKERGMEFVTIPIQVKYLEVELQRLHKSIENYNASSRCSIHVHLNVRDMSFEELKIFLAIYMIYEKCLYKFSGARHNNNFCIPLHYNREYIYKFCEHLTYAALWTGWYKYFGLNLCPIYGGESAKLGTVEFRHMEGNFNIPYILAWINLIVSIKLASKRFNSVEELTSNIMTMNTSSSYNELTERIFGEYAGHFTHMPTFKEDVESCISIAKTIFCGKAGKKEAIVIPLIKRGN